MTGEEMRKLVDRFTTSWRRRDVAALAACYAPDCIVVSPTFRTMRGLEQVQHSYRDLFAAFDGPSIVVDDVILDEESDRIAMIWTTKSIHRGEIFGMPGTGRTIQMRMAFILTLRDGAIAKEVRVYDFTNMLMQLGVLRARAS
jgi:steroid delta-isomerase-like uncharacterized protein